jgi:hypothetical protein
VSECVEKIEAPKIIAPPVHVHTYIHTCRGIASVEIFKGYDAVSSNDVLSNNVLYNDVLSNDVLS